MPDAAASLAAQLFNPPAEYGMWPFWFWNDDLTGAELLRQLRAFHAAGAGGVVIHPRIGLSARVGYLTPEYFRLVRAVTDECAALGMGVILYDEGSYPSGSAAGRVVAEDPAHAARALVRVSKRIEGPWTGYWRPAVNRSLDHRLVSVTLARLADGTGDETAGRWAVDPAALRALDVEERGLVRIETPEGRWVAVACLDVPSGGTIRGVLPEHEDDSPLAPAAGDIMNPAAVASFIRLTHDAYAAALGDHMGRTVVAMFTDEPSPLGRGARREAWPYTPGFDAYVAERLGWPPERLRAWLPALWLDYGPAGETFRQDYTAAVERRIGEVFYAAQAEWCDRHGIALTGHPHSSNDMASLRRFHWPGQDAVWRWVLPRGEDNNTSGIEGAHSVSAKAATSGARVYGRRAPNGTQRIATELFGAYGWRLSLDEAKWLIDWHLVRGNNLFLAHAFFYSVRDARAYESEPDLGLHNVWWPHFQRLMRYTRSLCWLLAGCEHVCEVAVLGTGHALPWGAARRLYEQQIDFLYIDDAALSAASVRDGRLVCGEQAFRVVVRDGDVPLSRRAAGRLAEFSASGGLLLDAGQSAEVVSAVRPASLLTASHPDLRVMHVRRAGLDAHLWVNEGEESIDVQADLPRPSSLIDPLRETVTALPQGPLRFVLSRRELRILLLAELGGGPLAGPRTGTEIALREWTVAAEGGRPSTAPPLRDWTAAPELERFSGTLVYRTTVTLDGPPAAAQLDLGDVGEAAEVLVNGQSAGFALWAPYQVLLPAHLFSAGKNVLDVRVTNSAANHYEGALRRSGLIGPVALHLAESGPGTGLAVSPLVKERRS
ncbi:MAG TPA: hypothetical protein VFN74_14265 [Chloroflexota bacterium]|nr:hypothetical protein [Chloroflexota bacterium]